MRQKLQGNRWDTVSRYYIGTYQTCKDLRCLPKTGGLEDQHYLIIRMFCIIASEVAKQEREAMKRARSK